MSATAQELYDATCDAILSVLTNGQHIGSDGRIFTKANLGELRKLKAELAAEVRASIPFTDRIMYGVKRRST